MMFDLVLGWFMQFFKLNFPNIQVDNKMEKSVESNQSAIKHKFNYDFKPKMTKETLRDICIQNKLYYTPSHNDVLFLHFKGYSKIENLDEYTGLKCIWLENNCITEISGLQNQTELVSLYMHHNVISKIENLNFSINLNTINLSHNFIKIIENLDILQKLNSLDVSHNKLSTVNDIAHLADCKTLSIVDLSHNYLDDPEIIEVFGKMKSLRVLYLIGNSVISKIKNYRKTLTLKCKELCHLDERPIFKKDRLCAEAWSTGGIEAEQALRTRLSEEEHDRILDSVNALMKLRQKSDEQTGQVTPTTPFKGHRSGAAEAVGKDSRDSLLVTKDYYDEHDTSDDSCSTDESTDDHDFPKIAIGRKVDTRQTGEEDLQSLSSNSTETNECRENGFTSRAERRVFGSGELDLKKNIDTNPIIENDCGVRKCVDTCSKSCLSVNEKTSRVISTEGLHALKIIPDPAEDDEFSSVVSESANSDKVEDISIRLPWTPPCVEEVCHIKQSFI